jgi:3-oxoacyl-[acyl-carrier protein] reductase
MLDGKTVLLTGTNGGIGISITETLLKNRAKLLLFYNNDRLKIDELIEKNPNYSSQIEVIQVDLINSESLERAISKIKFFDIDILIHAPSLPIEHKSIQDMGWTDFQKHIDLQSKSFFQLTKSILPIMKSKKVGKIISILTTYVVGSPPSKISDYIVGKYSLLGLTKCFAVELAPFGITVNSISPSMTDTPLIEDLPLKLKQITANQNPMKRLCEPHDVASAVLFFCSKHSNFITGENLIVSGGHTMH